MNLICWLQACADTSAYPCGTWCISVFLLTETFAWEMPAYLILRVAVGDLQHGHGSCHGLDCSEDVLEDTFGERFSLFL